VDRKERLPEHVPLAELKATRDWAGADAERADRSQAHAYRVGATSSGHATFPLPRHKASGPKRGAAPTDRPDMFAKLLHSSAPRSSTEPETGDIIAPK
jgi:hypothetical protein